MSCSENQLTGLSELKNTRNPLQFTEIDVSNNELTQISTDLKKFSNLESFEATRNQISRILVDTLPKSVKLLKLAHNNFNALTGDMLEDLVGLEEIHFQNNYITCVDEGLFKKLPNLKVINLYNNQIQTLPVIAFMQEYSRLNVQSNPIECESRQAEMLKSYRAFET